MKIADKTPLVDEKGNLGLVQRIQGMLEYGFNWPRELEAQSSIIKYFDRELGKNYNLIRNISLGASGIMIPMVIIGPTGIYVIEVSHLKGRYEAKGEAWNAEAGDSYKPAPVNLIHRTMRMARALQTFIERQGVRLPVDVEPVLIAGDPGLHIESNRPAIKVMMIDGIKAFVNGVATGRPTLNNMQVNDFTERILTPRPKVDMSALPPEPEPEPDPASRWQETYDWEKPAQPESFAQLHEEPSRARAIFDAQDDAKSYNPNDIGFAMESETEVDDIPPIQREPEPSPARPLRKSASQQQLIMGMTTFQLAVIGALALSLICILAIFAYMFLL